RERGAGSYASPLASKPHTAACTRTGSPLASRFTRERPSVAPALADSIACLARTRAPNRPFIASINLRGNSSVRCQRFARRGTHGRLDVADRPSSGVFNPSGFSRLDPLHRGVTSPSMAPARLRKGERCARGAVERAAPLPVQYSSDTGRDHPGRYPVRLIRPQPADEE